MDNLVAALLIALATWRLGHLLAQERGPYGILIRIRSLCGIVHDDDGKPETWKGEIAEWIMCPWCNGLWLAGGLTAVWMYAPLIVVALAAAAAALFAGQWFGKRG